jgi:molybdopterin-binding protein
MQLDSIRNQAQGANKMKVGARNRIIGKVTQIKKGSLMTIESLKELGIKKGDTVEVVVKGVNVLLIRN